MILYQAWVGLNKVLSRANTLGRNDPCNLPSISPSYSSTSDAGWLERVALGFNLLIS